MTLWGLPFIEVLTAAAVIVSTASVIVTTVYVVLTSRIASANKQMVAVMQEQVEILDRPYVEVSTFLVTRSTIVYLKIKNTGRTSAYNLRLTMNKDFYKHGRQSAENNLSHFNAFTQPIPTFSPGAELVFSLANSLTLFADNAREEITPLVFCIQAEYAYRHRTISESTTIDLGQYFQSEVERDPLIERIDEMTRTWASLGRSVEGIRSSLPVDDPRADLDEQP